MSISWENHSVASASSINLGDTGSRIIATFQPTGRIGDGNSRSEANPERAAFKQAFYATLEGKAEGALSPYLFYDPPNYSEENNNPDYRSAWGSKDNPPYGAPGWDAHIAENTNTDLNNNSAAHYGFAEGDEEVIKTALQNGLLNELPRRMTYYSYGPGELIAVQKKDFQLLDALLQSGQHIVDNINAVDINSRYAKKFASEANDRYNRATNGIQGDFMEGTLNLGHKAGTSVIAIFGGPFANAPHIFNQVTAKQKAAQYLAQLVSQHGEATRVINTVDTSSDKKALLEDYAPTRKFEAFILGAFPRAVVQGIIKKPYDVFDNWKLTTAFNEAERAVKLIAEAKKAHTLTTEDRKFKIKKGDEFVFTLSHKWNEKDWTDIYKAAGLDEIKFFGNGSRKLVVAKAVRDPDLSLIRP